MGSAPLPPWPSRARAGQLLLVVGAVLVVSAGGTAAAVFTDGSARVLLLVLAAAAAGASAWSSSARLRSSEEVLAAAAVALAVLGVDAGSPLLRGPVVPLAVLAAVFLVLSRLLQRAATWPLAAWATGQLAALRALDGTDADLPRTAVTVAVAVVGLGIAVAGRRLVARIALLTALPWWAAGAIGGAATAWTASGQASWLAVRLVLLAAAALVLARLERRLEPMLGPPVAVPVLSGVVAGAALGGALSSPGPVAVPLAGYTGVLLASTAAALLTGWRRGLLLPAAVAAGGTLVLICVVQLVAAERWHALSLFLLVTALPSVAVAVRRPDDRPTAAPTALGCLAGSALVAVPAGVLGPATAAVVLGCLYAAALGAGLALDVDTRRATVLVGAVCALLAVCLLASVRDRGLALQLAGQGLLTCAWAWYGWRSASTPPDDTEASPAWRAGSLQLVVAAWIGADIADWAVLEAYTLPAAVGLLVAAGPRLFAGPSWPAWGPGLLVAAVPSVVWAVVAPGSTRPVLVLVVAAAVMALAARRAVRAPLTIAAGTALALAVGLAAVELPVPVAGALVVGTALLALGISRERAPVAGFGARLAEMR